MVAELPDVLTTELAMAALRYAARGWPVLPLVPKSKEPLARLVAHGVKDATADPRTVHAWWEMEPTANIGIAVPTGLFVLDVDPRAGGNESLAELERKHGPLPATIECLTGGGGRHLYFRVPHGLRLRGKLGPGLDVKANGSYVVAPPSLHPSGGAYVWEVSGHPADVEPAPAPMWLLDLLSDGQAARPAADDAPIPEGERNATLTSLAGAMRRKGMSPAAIEAALLAENAARCAPPLDKDEVRTIARSVGRYDPAPAGEPDLQKDYGHATVLAGLFKDRYRWATHRGAWMAWSGEVWRPLAEEAVAKVAADELRRHYATEMAATTDKAALQDLGKKVTETCVYSRITGALNFLKGWPGILTLAEEWDRDPWLLNVRNGTLDLRDCTLRPHNPADLLTQMAPVDYEPTAKGERWQQHLATFLPDPEVRRQVQRDLGVSLVGADLEEILPIWFGGGGNGKSTTLRVFRELLGDYAKMAAPRLLIQSKYERHPTELADLCGARLVFSVEIGSGSRLDEERVKALTGGESVRARFMRQDLFEFPRTWTITLVCNHKPEIRGSDAGIWRRIRLVPWTVALPREQQRPQDEVVRELLAEGPAILAWLLDGLRDWQRDRHWRAQAVEAATEGYRQEQDVLAPFVADCCDFGPRYTVPVGALYDAYVGWCERNGEEPLKKDAFRRMLVDRGARKSREGHDNTPTWHGIRLRPLATTESGSSLGKTTRVGQYGKGGRNRSQSEQQLVDDGPSAAPPLYECTGCGAAVPLAPVAQFPGWLSYTCGCGASGCVHRDALTGG